MFEFITIGRPVALRCLNRLTALGFGGFDLALGDTKTLTLGGWVDATEMATHLLTLPHETNSGDVYCVPGDQP
ncbi:hypothetical protein ACGFIK_11705 [Micromonospora sp. NPDC048871]|uniref:hypothetical protein n=1 Tax=unclassified Micromonospora TaxID=2617518 RepID=UPI002E0E0653|nr:hypothetical protein OIE53_08110 [Micromonospora sp. NBC_01739]